MNAVQFKEYSYDIQNVFQLRCAMQYVNEGNSLYITTLQQQKT